MMKNGLLIVVSASVLGLGACNKHDGAAATNEGADGNQTIANDTSANATVEAGPLTGQGIANAAAASDRFEIESSKLAATSAKSAAVKSFADKMISAHTASTAKLKSTVAAMSPAVTPDDTLSADQQQKLDSLKNAKGADFDTAYAAAQVDAHQATLDALKGYAASGDNATLKGFANGLIPTVTAHLNMAKALK